MDEAVYPELRDPDGQLMTLLVFATVWIFSILCVCVVAALIVRWTLAKARRQDVPALLGGFANVIAALGGWLIYRNHDEPPTAPTTDEHRQVPSPTESEDMA